MEKGGPTQSSGSIWWSLSVGLCHLRHFLSSSITRVVRSLLVPFTSTSWDDGGASVTSFALRSLRSLSGVGRNLLSSTPFLSLLPHVTLRCLGSSVVITLLPRASRSGWYGEGTSWVTNEKSKRDEDRRKPQDHDVERTGRILSINKSWNSLGGFSWSTSSIS